MFDACELATWFSPKLSDHARHSIFPHIMPKMRLSLVQITCQAVLRMNGKRRATGVRCTHMKCHCQPSRRAPLFLRSKRVLGEMKLKLHHINLSTNNLSGMDHFYRNVLGLKAEKDGLPVLEKKKGYDGNVVFVSDDHIQTHLAQKDLNVSFRTGHTINPLEADT